MSTATGGDGCASATVSDEPGAMSVCCCCCDDDGAAGAGAAEPDDDKPARDDFDDLCCFLDEDVSDTARGAVRRRRTRETPQT